MTSLRASGYKWGDLSPFSFIKEGVMKWGSMRCGRLQCRRLSEHKRQPGASRLQEG